MVRGAVEGIKEYVPGKSVAGAIKLASNENPFGPSPKALEAIAKEGKNLQIYPDEKATLLREALATKFALAPDNFICGNGSDEIMQILGSTYINPGDEIIIPKNTFSVYELITRIFDGRVVLADLKDYAVDLDNILAKITDKTKMVFLANPNNPTGSYFTEKGLSAFMRQLPEKILLVIDEAYAEFVDDKEFPAAINYVTAGRNVFILRTFSKYYGLAGLRIGYGLAKPELIKPMYRTKLPFSVNRLAQVGAVAALSDNEFLEKTYQNNLAGKLYLYQQLEKLGLSFKKTGANFIFVELKRSADDVFLKLLKTGVIIRPLTSFGFPEAIRVSIGRPEQNERLINELANLFSRSA